MIDKGYLLGGRYKIISVLGEGGMANVYLAEDIILQRKVAVKVLRLDLQKDPQTIQRFQREAQSTSDLSHPNIVSILDVGSEHNRHYLVMEYVDGPDLEEYIQKNKPIPFEKVISIMDQILSAMNLAHRHNVIHRDLKPQNILMDKKGNIKIVDFGIAVALNQSTMTQTNTAMGSVHYMSPEQARGSMATKQSDIYSLGIVLYELLMGKVPFTGENAVAVALKHFQEKTPSLKAQNPKIPQALENVVLKATAKSPHDRYNSVLEMKQDLDTSLDPDRRGELPFNPEHDPEQDETIILPALNGSVHDKASDNNEDNSKDKVNTTSALKPSLWDNIKKHKWWWIIAMAAFLGIMITLIVALDHKDDVNVPDVSNMTPTQARQELASSGLKAGTITKKYSNSIKKGRVVRSVPSSGSTLKSGRIVDLIVSKGQHYVLVPDVTGITYQSAQKRLKKLGFKVQKDEDYSFVTANGNVISQDIDPGQKMNPSKTTIKLIVSKGMPPNRVATIKLRDLIGYSLKGAQDYARDNNLNLNINQEYSDKQKDTVIKQSPQAGTELHGGETLSLTISKGKEESDDSDDHDSSSKDITVTKSFTIPYQQDDSNNKKGNHVQIYVSDASHSLDNIYRDLYISKDESFSIPFNLSKGAGHIKIVRDGKTLLDEDIDK
ncbi:serine/threonine-protein kinase [Lactobacillus colini]|uniref:non-specific serine/threonine protein kinase n=1 Tax=Lactobacillus colini TaxID=1819254 RepID=A0ABS4MB93_9LACO|nr:serine/threonine-protein kinase [Lactobacillus colini]